MPQLNDQQIDSMTDPEALVRLLTDAGEKIPPRLRERILAFGPAVIPPLIAVMEDEALFLEEGPGEGWAPIRAAELLGELRATEAIEPMLRRVATVDWDTYLHETLTETLPTFGPAILYPTLAAPGATTDSRLRIDYSGLLTKLGIRDDRILAALVEDLQHDQVIGAGNLAEYGDPRAVPALSQALDEYKDEDKGDDFMANMGLADLVGAIEDLGGKLTPEQQQKVERIRAREEPKRQRFVSLFERAMGRMDLGSSPADAAAARATDPRLAAPPRKIGRNDPCPCGSGKKYKKCCLGQDRG
jgi:hypothetical protein